MALATLGKIFVGKKVAEGLGFGPSSLNLNKILIIGASGLSLFAGITQRSKVLTYGGIGGLTYSLLFLSDKEGEKKQEDKEKIPIVDDFDDILVGIENLLDELGLDDLVKDVTYFIGDQIDNFLDAIGLQDSVGKALDWVSDLMETVNRKIADFFDEKLGLEGVANVFDFFADLWGGRPPDPKEKRIKEIVLYIENEVCWKVLEEIIKKRVDGFKKLFKAIFAKFLKNIKEDMEEKSNWEIIEQDPNLPKTEESLIEKDYEKNPDHWIIVQNKDKTKKYFFDVYSRAKEFSDEDIFKRIHLYILGKEIDDNMKNAIVWNLLQVAKVTFNVKYETKADWEVKIERYTWGMANWYFNDVKSLNYLRARLVILYYDLSFRKRPTPKQTKNYLMVKGDDPNGDPYWRIHWSFFESLLKKRIKKGFEILQIKNKYDIPRAFMRYDKNGGDRFFLVLLYLILLKRAPDPGGWQYWHDVIIGGGEKGKGLGWSFEVRKKLAGKFLDSEEFKNLQKENKNK